jgi:hypothetical protein
LSFVSTTFVLSFEFLAFVFVVIVVLYLLLFLLHFVFYVSLHDIVIQCFGVHCYVIQALFLHFISHALSFFVIATFYFFKAQFFLVEGKG